MPIYPKTDKTILESILSGDEVCWQDFYDRYAPVVRTLCFAAHLPDDLHDDVVQEVMSRFHRCSGRYVYAPERARFRTYFNRIVRAAIADEFRKKAKRERISAESPEVYASAVWESAELEAWRKAVFEEALHELSERVNSVNYLAFTMSSLQGQPVSVVARFLGISAARVYLARSRCMNILQKIVRRCNECDPELQINVPGK